MILKIRHIGILSKKFDESLKFYKELGFKVIYEKEEQWDEFGRLYIVKLESSNGVVIELIKKDTAYLNQIQNTHICFQVDDLEKIYNKLKNKSINFTVLPRLSPDKSVKVAFIEDPNGYKIELVEELK